MKKSLMIMIAAFLAFGMMACGEKKITQKDLEAAEAKLFNEDGSMNESVAPKVAEKYCEFVEQNPEDSTAPLWLYHAMEINVMLKNPDKSIELGNQLLSQYPESKVAPRSLFLLGSFVYDDMLQDTAQAHVMLQRLIDDYPQSRHVKDAERAIEFLGLTPDQIMSIMAMEQMVEEE